MNSIALSPGIWPIVIRSSLPQPSLPWRSYGLCVARCFRFSLIRCSRISRQMPLHPSLPRLPRYSASAPSFSSGTEEGFGSQASLQSTAYKPTMKTKWITMTGKMTELGALSLPAIWYRWHKSKSTDLPETVAWSLSLNESFASRNVILEV